MSVIEKLNQTENENAALSKTRSPLSNRHVYLELRSANAKSLVIVGEMTSSIFGNQSNRRLECWQQIWRTFQYKITRWKIQSIFQFIYSEEESFSVSFLPKTSQKCSCRRMNIFDASVALKFVAFMAALTSVDGKLDDSNKASDLSTRSSSWWGEIVVFWKLLWSFFHCLCFYCSSLVVVSTLDGKLSVLDSQENGKLLWTLPAFHGPLLSSSLSSIQVLHTYPTNN